MPPPVAIIGAGRVGSALGAALKRAGWPVVAVAARTAASARRAAKFVGAPAMEVRQAAALAKLVLVTVPDDAVAGVARELVGPVKRGAVVAHTSGALSSDALAAVRRSGARAASVHPLMTFPTPAKGLAALRGAHFFFEGDRGSSPLLRRMILAVGGVPVPVSKRGKALYHAGAVLACNDLVALLAEAFALFRQAGIPGKKAAGALGPLVRRTVENVLALGPARALTGPVARGDAGSVARHLKALHGPVREIYRVLGLSTLRLARLSPGRRRVLESLLRIR
ncbi:MAG: DUF2520 domain-containing protein [Planctomycetes bacterium]|nr:DUF2520 domain-containing protein [Planctomycetota bacterium]